MVKPKKHRQQEKEVVEKEVEVEDRTGIGRRLKELDDTLRGGGGGGGGGPYGHRAGAAPRKQCPHPVQCGSGGHGPPHWPHHAHQAAVVNHKKNDQINNQAAARRVAKIAKRPAADPLVETLAAPGGQNPRHDW
eukprot:1184080-Prorocentrum_minimum.AAC.2